MQFVFFAELFHERTSNKISTSSGHEDKRKICFFLTSDLAVVDDDWSDCGRNAAVEGHYD